MVKYLVSIGANSSQLKKKYHVTLWSEIQNIPSNESNEIEENKKQYDKTQQEWVQKELAFRNEISALEKQRKEAIDSAARETAVLTKKLNESLKENVKLQEEIDEYNELRKGIQKETLKQMVALEIQRREDVSLAQANKQNESKQGIDQLQKHDRIEELKLHEQTKIFDSSILEFRGLLVNIAQELTAEEWKNMCHRYPIPKNKQPDSAFRFFWWLVETNLINSVNVNVLEALLIQHHRQDLVQQFIYSYRSKNGNK